MKNTDKQAIRQKAEKKLNEIIADDKKLAENESLKLIHELQVHQLELEILNEELRQSKQEAELITEKYAGLYDFAPSSYFTLSEFGTIRELNLTAAKMLGMDRALLQNKVLSHFVSKDSKAIFENFLQRIFQNRKIEFCEITVISYDKVEYVLYLSGIAHVDEEYCFITAVDISERKKLENDLVFAKKKAEESDRLKTAFLQNMSHEIRSPLNAIKGFSQILWKFQNNKERLEQYTRIIDQRSDDLLNIINDLLDISKIESGQLPVHIEAFHLNTLFGDLKIQFQEVQNRLHKEHIYFDMKIFDLPEETVIETDLNKLKQILINLLTNAFKFTSQGQIIGGCKLEGNQFVFFVSDTGIGIPHDKQKIIFDRFIQLKQDPGQSFGGTGLGLSIVRGLVSLLGGNVFVESEPGKGSTFSFKMPKDNFIFHDLRL